MRKKYMVFCTKHDGFWDNIYSTDSLIKAICYLIKAKLKYEFIDFEIRDFD